MTQSEYADLLRKLPRRFEPVRELVYQLALDPEALEPRMILNDWIEEQTWNVGAELFKLTGPTSFQKEITLFVVSRGTALSHVPKRDTRIDRLVAEHALAVAKRQLGIHSHASWVRCVVERSQTLPKGGEVMLDYVGCWTFPRPEYAHKKREHTREATLDALRNGRADRCMAFRARCNVPGCITECTATSVIPFVDREEHAVTRHDEVIGDLNAEDVLRRPANARELETKGSR